MIRVPLLHSATFRWPFSAFSRAAESSDSVANGERANTVVSKGQLEGGIGRRGVSNDRAEQATFISISTRRHRCDDTFSERMKATPAQRARYFNPSCIDFRDCDASVRPSVRPSGRLVAVFVRHLNARSVVLVRRQAQLQEPVRTRAETDRVLYVGQRSSTT